MMTTTDIRDTNFEHLRDTLELKLREVYEAFASVGPCTTRQLADAAKIDILTVRPRAHDLCEIGLLRLTGHSKSRGRREGIYEAVTPDEWRAWHSKLFSTGAQMQMGLNQQGALTV